MIFRLLNKYGFFYFIIVLLYLLFVSSCNKNGKEDKSLTMHQFIPRQMHGWVMQETPDIYDRETIFDYINGAGEVYLSYDFQKVAVFRFTKSGEPEITVELFDMSSAEDAYGVFSHARENEEIGIGNGYEFKGSLMCFWKAKYFVCVLAQKGTPKTKDAVFEIAKAIDKKIAASGNKPELVGYLPEEKLIPSSVRFFHTHPSLNYHYFLAEQNILNLNRQTRAVLASYEPGSIYLLCIRYHTSEQASKGYRGFIENYLPEAKSSGVAQIEPGKWAAVKFEREYVIIALDASSEESAMDLVERFRKKLSETAP